MWIKSRSHLNIILLLGSLFLLTGLSGCKHNLLMDNDPQPSMCKKLKRQMMYNRFNHNVEAAWSAPSQRERLYQLYREYQCH